MIHYERQGSVAIVRIEQGKVNVIDKDLLSDLAATLAGIEESSARAVVLTGAGSSFSAGVDLFRVLEGGRDYLESFLPALTASVLTLFTFPRPVVAAINGHAIAGGCILACACDYKIMAKGPGKMGVLELAVGVPFPAIALEVMRFATPRRYVQELMYTGRTCSADEALRKGLVDEIVDADELLERAAKVAEQLGMIPSKSFQITKRQLRQPVIDRFRDAGQAIDSEVMESWGSPEIESAIRQYMEKTIGKSK